ncbi:MAG: hypothetical protein JST59_18805 [Actinobacteria bacterium]|nr:hypothetical protein [Actinomycetota bacterium]
MALFALDHNYPAPIVDQARPYLRNVELVPIGDIDARLPDFDDWELLLALHHHERDWDGMVTNDTSMLEQDRELAVLGFTCLTLVAPVAAGHDPIRSTGLLLAHIENIASRTTPSKPQVWKLHGRTPQGQHPDVFLEALARRASLDPFDLRKAAMPDRSILTQDPLSSS